MKTIIAALALCVPAFCAPIPVTGSGYSECAISYDGNTIRSGGWRLSFYGSADGVDIGLSAFHPGGSGYCPDFDSTLQEGTAFIGDFSSNVYAYSVGEFLEVGSGPSAQRVEIIGYVTTRSEFSRDSGFVIWSRYLYITPTAPIPEPGGMAIAGLMSLAGLRCYRRIRGRYSAAKPGPR